MTCGAPDVGWYTARRRSEPADQPPTVVRLSQGLDGTLALVWQIGRRDPEPASDWQLLDKIKINGDVRSIEIDRVQKEARSDGVRQGRAEAVEEQRSRERNHPVYTADFPSSEVDFLEVGEPRIAVRMTVAEAESLDASLSDFLCWSRGFRAALRHDDHDREPMGVEAIRRMRETLNRAQQSAARKEEIR